MTVLPRKGEIMYKGEVHTRMVEVLGEGWGDRLTWTLDQERTAAYLTGMMESWLWPPTDDTELRWDKIGQAIEHELRGLETTDDPQYHLGFGEATMRWAIERFYLLLVDMT
jgi:hypothetical protein